MRAFEVYSALHVLRDEEVSYITVGETSATVGVRWDAFIRIFAGLEVQADITSTSEHLWHDVGRVRIRTTRLLPPTQTVSTVVCPATSDASPVPGVASGGTR